MTTEMQQTPPSSEAAEVTQDSSGDALSHSDSPDTPALFDAAEIAWFQSEDAETGRALLRILATAFIYVFCFGVLCSYWTMTVKHTPLSLTLFVCLPLIAIIVVSVGMGWGVVMLSEKESDH